MDVSALDAIDVHTHVHRSVSAATPEAGQALEAMAAYFKTEAAAYTVDESAGGSPAGPRPAGTHAATSRMPIAASPRPARCTQRSRSPSTTLASSTVTPG